MQTSLSELLINEHNVILEAGKLIESSNKLWETDPVAYSKQVSFLTDFFSEYGDEFHHQKEEEILFPAINKANEMVGASIVSELIEHHEDFRNLLQKIRNACTQQDYVSAQKYLETYLQSLKDHIAAENDELFPMADDLFSPDEIERLYYRCIDKDEELGVARKQEFENHIIKLNGNEAVR